MQKRSSNIITLLIGLAIGILAGMLFSPGRGSNIRNSLFYQLKKIVEKTKSLFMHLLHFHSSMTMNNSARVASQEVIDKTIQKAHKLLEEVKALSGQLDDNNSAL